jgi:glycosyltransferase involved in cell wall biosynthesis
MSLRAGRTTLTVLHVIPDLFPFGGTPRKIVGVGHALRDLGTRQALLVFRDADPGMVAQVVSAGGLVCQAAVRSAFDPRFVLEIAAAAKHVDADVVVTHFARADIYGALGSRVAGRPAIKDIEGIFWSDRRRVIALDGALSSLRFLVLANSRASLDAARQRGRIGASAVVYLGVEDSGARDMMASRDVRVELGIPECAFVVGHVGGLIPLRRQSTLVDAAAAAVAASPGRCLRLLIVGDGPSRRVLERRIKEKRLSEVVMLVGYRDDVPRLRNAFDAYANPTEAEGFGLATVEAMLLGIPVIVASAGASPELIIDGESGVLVPAGDSTALGRAIAAIVDQPEWAAALGKRARAEALRRFSMARYATELDDIYRRAAGSWGRRRKVDRCASSS